MSTHGPGGAALPTPPRDTPAPVSPQRSEALEAELGALEAVLPSEPAAGPEPPPDAAPEENSDVR